MKQTEAEWREAFQRSLNLLGQMMIDDSSKYFPQVTGDILYYTLGLAGEAGEVADELKKAIRVGEDLEGVRLLKFQKELTDVFIYWCLAQYVTSLDFWQMYDMIKADNDVRFGGNDEASTDHSD